MYEVILLTLLGISQPKSFFLISCDTFLHHLTKVNNYTTVTKKCKSSEKQRKKFALLTILVKSAISNSKINFLLNLV